MICNVQCPSIRCCHVVILLALSVKIPRVCSFIFNLRNYSASLYSTSLSLSKGFFISFLLLSQRTVLPLSPFLCKFEEEVEKHGRLGAGGDSGSAVRAVNTGTVVPASWTNQGRWVRKHANEWALYTSSRHHLLRSDHHIPCSYWSSHIHRLTLSSHCFRFGVIAVPICMILLLILLYFPICASVFLLNS